MSPLLDELRVKLDEAAQITQKKREQEEHSRFAKAYKYSKKRTQGGIWPDGSEAGFIYYMEDGKRQQSALDFSEVGILAGKKKEGKISEITFYPDDLGKIAGSISKALDFAFKPEAMPGGRRSLAGRAVCGMYLTGLTDNRTLLRKIEKGIKQPESAGVTTEIGEKFFELGMVDDYHSDLSPQYAGVLAAVLDAKLRPEGKMSDEEAFEKGFQEVYSDKGNLLWSSGALTPKASYTLDEVAKSRRISQMEVSDLAQKVADERITDLKISPKDQGRLYAGVKKSIDALLSHPQFKDGEGRGKIVVRDIMAGLYLLGRLQEEQAETRELLSGVVDARPELGKVVEAELQKYEAVH